MVCAHHQAAGEAAGAMPVAPPGVSLRSLERREAILSLCESGIRLTHRHQYLTFSSLESD